MAGFVELKLKFIKKHIEVNNKPFQGIH